MCHGQASGGVVSGCPQTMALGLRDRGGVMAIGRERPLNPRGGSRRPRRYARTSRARMRVEIASMITTTARIIARHTSTAWKLRHSAY